MDKRIVNIIKGKQNLELIAKDIKENGQGKCYILSNEDKIITDYYLFLICQSMFCSQPNYPCLQCVKCKQVENNNNIDICYFGDDEGTVKKESIEKLLECAITKPYEYDRKFIVVKNGDGLSDANQNMLLKMLEDLNPFVTVLITLTNIDKVLKTVKSRSRNYCLQNLSKADIISLIGSSERSLNICNVTNNNLSYCLMLEKSKDFDTMYNLAFKLCNDFDFSNQMLKFSSALAKDKDKLATYLYVIKGTFYTALTGQIECLTSKVKLAKIIDHVVAAEIKLSRHVNALMVIDYVLLGILEIKNE